MPGPGPRQLLEAYLPQVAPSELDVLQGEYDVGSHELSESIALLSPLVFFDLKAEVLLFFISSHRTDYSGFVDMLALLLGQYVLEVFAEGAQQLQEPLVRQRLLFAVQVCLDVLLRDLGAQLKLGVSEQVMDAAGHDLVRYVQFIGDFALLLDLPTGEKEKGVLRRNEEVARHQFDLGVLLPLIKSELLREELLECPELLVDGEIGLLVALCLRQREALVQLALQAARLGPEPDVLRRAPSDSVP